MSMENDYDDEVAIFFSAGAHGFCAMTLELFFVLFLTM